MRKMLFLFIVLGIGLMATQSATAKMYKWVDQSGVTHFTDTPPPDTISDDQIKTLPTVRYSAPDPVESQPKPRSIRSGSYNRTFPAKKVSSRRSHKVELYSTSWCGYCKKARRFFQSRGIPFKEYDIEKDKSAARRKKELGSGRGVPFAVINGRKIQGYAEAAYESALNSD